jgi:hypothetical protein
MSSAAQEFEATILQIWKESQGSEQVCNPARPPKPFLEMHAPSLLLASHLHLQIEQLCMNCWDMSRAKEQERVTNYFNTYNASAMSIYKNIYLLLKTKSKWKQILIQATFNMLCKFWTQILQFLCTVTSKETMYGYFIQATALHDIIWITL